MSLNQVELNEIVLENLNQYYEMCSIPPVQHHWIDFLQQSEMKMRYPHPERIPVEESWKKIWAFKHWYMQKYFGDIVDAAMKITLQPDAFRYYVLRYRDDHDRSSRFENPAIYQAPVSNIETSQPSNDKYAGKTEDTAHNYPIYLIDELQAPKPEQENYIREQEMAQNSTISPADDTLQGSAQDKGQELPIFMPGCKIGDPPGFTWCKNEANGQDRCNSICEACYTGKKVIKNKKKPFACHDEWAGKERCQNQCQGCIDWGWE